MNQCLNCGKKTNNPKFCSRSCSVIFNNKKNPKRKPQNKCKICKTPITKRKTYCNKCQKYNPNNIDYNNLTLNDLKEKRSYQKHSRIRALARNKYLKSNRPKKCYICNYDKHFHICHIKPIKSFSENTKISKINHNTNLIALCPNHHWEFDNNLFCILYPL